MLSRHLPGSAVFYGRHKTNLGQGAALHTGIEFALRKGAEYIVTFDADGQHRAQDVDRLIQPVLEGKADVALGSRFLDPSHIKAIPLRRRWLLRQATLFTRLSTGLQVTDTHNGLRCFSRAAAQSIQIRHRRMAHASEILLELKRLGLRFVEVPVHITYTSYSIQKGQSIWGAFLILRDLMVLKRNPASMVPATCSVQSHALQEMTLVH